MCDIFTAGPRVSFIGREAHMIKDVIVNHNAQIKPTDCMDEEAILFVVDCNLVKKRILVGYVLEMMKRGKRLLIIGSIDSEYRQILNNYNINFEIFTCYEKAKLAIFLTLNGMLEERFGFYQHSTKL